MQKLLLLHGAIGSQQQFADLKIQLQHDFEVHTLNFSGHGGNAIPDEPFSMALFAKDVLNYLDKNDMEIIDIFGYSMGGYVALYLAKYFPFRIEKIFTLATKFDWNENTSLKESAMLNPEVIMEKLHAFAATLEQRHYPSDWKLLLHKTAQMIIEMGNKIVLTDTDLNAVEQMVLLSVGDADKMITLEETKNANAQIKNSELLILENTPHPIEKVNVELLAKHLVNFFKN